MRRSFAIWSKLAPLILLRMLLNTLGSFSMPKWLELRGFSLVRVQATSIFFETSIWTVAHRRGIQGAPEDVQNWFAGSADIKNALHQMRVPGWLQVIFALPVVLASEVGYAGKTINQKRLAPDSLILFLQHFRWVFLGRCFSVKMSPITGKC